MTITLTPEIEQPLMKEARHLGTAPELLAMEALRQRFVITELSATDVPLDVALADLIAEAERLEPQNPAPGMKGPFSEMLAVKYREQGIEI